MSDDLYYTKGGIEKAEATKQKLFDELKRIQNGKGEAAEVGGNQWHDNFSFEQLCRDEVMVNKRISELLGDLRRAVIVDDTPQDNSLVRIGTIVHLYNETDEKDLIYQIGGHGDTDLEATPPIIAYNAPIVRPFFLQGEGVEKKVSIKNRIVEISIEKIDLKEN